MHLRWALLFAIASLAIGTPIVVGPDSPPPRTPSPPPNVQRSVTDIQQGGEGGTLRPNPERRAANPDYHEYHYYSYPAVSESGKTPNVERDLAAKAKVRDAAPAPFSPQFPEPEPEPFPYPGPDSPNPDGPKKNIARDVAASPLSL